MSNNDALREAAIRVQAELETCNEAFDPMTMDLRLLIKHALAASKPEPNEADELLCRLGLDPEQYRTDGGYINHMKVRAAILHPDNYPRIDQCQHEFVHSADLGGRVCKLCGKPERVGSKPEPQAQQAFKPLTEERIQELLGIGNPSEEACRLIRLGWDAAHGITAPKPQDKS